MSLTIENGSGVIGADSYVDVAFITTYLTERGRETENLWSTAATAAQEAAAIQATDYIEQRFRQKFKGQKTYSNVEKARAVLLFTVQPSNSEVVVLGSDTFTFVSTVVGANDVLIESLLSKTISNLITAINEVSTEATTEDFFGQSLLAVAVPSGEDGNTFVSTTTVTGASWNFATLNGGNDQGLPQPLAFPRINLFDGDGIAILGIPLKLKQAIAEYSVRALATSLISDPLIDDTGRVVSKKLEKVGPIEETTSYEPGSATPDVLGVYPAADRLLRDFLGSTGGVLR